MKRFKTLLTSGMFLFGMGTAHAYSNLAQGAYHIHATYCVSYVLNLREGEQTFDCVYSQEGPFACESNEPLMAPAMAACVHGNYIELFIDDVSNTSLIISTTGK